jgi:hypothetical protein
VNSAFHDPEFLRRTLEEFSRGYAGLASLFQAPGSPGRGDWQAPLVETYRRLFQPMAPPGWPASGEAAAFPAAAQAMARYQQALARCAELATAIALDAARRLSAALADPAAPPITTLRELHELWIECGEAAYAEAAHGEGFAAAQAALIEALVELKAASP